MPLLSLIIIQ